MDILKGLLYINGEDVYETFGAYLAEENEGDYTNYAALLKIGKAKSRTSVDFPERHGRSYPKTEITRLDEREVTLRFAIEGLSPADFLMKYSRFVAMLCVGDEDGWINLYVPELGKTFKFLYSDCGEWNQLTPLDGKVYASFQVVFTEPNPNYEYQSNDN